MFIDSLNVDEVIGQLLASEGFNSVEELAMVDVKEIAGIEGFDEETAANCRPAPANIWKDRGELDAKRKELGVEDELKTVPGVTTAMLVKFGENGVKTVEDLAGCATDDLVGWTERKDGESRPQPAFSTASKSRARRRGDDHAGALKAGWITEADLAPPPVEEAAVAEAQPNGDRA
jgi:N utilization substance protein A